jgi:dihydrofolate reductase
MNKMNSVFIATSIDGYISDRNEGLDWLNKIKVTEGEDMGYGAFMNRVDALLMGRRTFEKICSFDMDWPYEKPVYVLSNTLSEVSEAYKGKVHLVKGELKAVLAHIHSKNHLKLYIDGGQLIQSFLAKNLIDEMIITTMPVLLGGGVRLFGHMPEEQWFTLVKSTVCMDQIVQNHYKRSADSI